MSNIYRKAFINGLQPPPNISISEWSDKYRILSRTEGSESGKWKTSRTPYLEEPMNELSPHSDYQKVVFMKGVQIGGTSIGLNFLAYCIHADPASFMFVEPTVDIAKKISKQRINGMIQEMPVLKERIKEDRSRQTSNTLFLKDFDGGILVLSGANSAASLRSMPIRFLILDEIDAYPADLDGEGSAVELAIKRTETFHNKKILLISTPTIKDESNIEIEFSLSDMRYYHIPCPQCGTYQKIEWKNIKFEYDKKYDLTSDVFYACVNGCRIDENNKTDFLSKGKWIKENPESNIAGFHLSSLYSPLGWKTWKSCVIDFLKYKKTRNIHVLKTFVNTVLGEAFELPTESVKTEYLLSRSKKILEGNKVSDDIVLIAAGADVQDDRIEVTIFGFGLNETIFVLEHIVVMGDPSQDDLWCRVKNVITKTYFNSYMQLNIMCTAIDSGGHFTDNVYAFCKDNKGLRIFAIQGANRAGLPIITKPNKNKVGALLFRLGTDTAKELIYAKLRIKNQKENGYISFDKKLNEEYFLQLTSEKRITRYIKGLPKKEWKKTRERNEALDCFVYGLAALHIYCFMVYPEKSVSDVLQYCSDFMKENYSKNVPENIVNVNVNDNTVNNNNNGGFRVLSKGIR